MCARKGGMEGIVEKVKYDCFGNPFACVRVCGW